jgi:ferredoxin
MNACTKRPEVDIGDCNHCGGCVSVCPAVFRLNDLGYIEVADLECYPEKEVDEAIADCPEDCIFWEEKRIL